MPTLSFNPFTGVLDYVGTTGGGGGGTLTTDGSGAATRVAYWTGATQLGGSPALFFDPNFLRLGIGTSTPGVQLHVAGDVQQTLAVEVASGTLIAAPRMAFQRANGTEAAPTAASLNTILGQLLWFGWDGNVAGPPIQYPVSSASIQCVVDEPTGIHTTGYGGSMRFFTTAIGTTSGSVEKMRLADDGSLLLGTTTKIAGSRAVVTGGALHVIGGNALRLQGAGAGFTSFVDPSHAANIAYTLPAAQATAVNQVLANDSTGVLSWISSPPATPTGTAGGDLSGTYPNPTVAKINTVPLGATTATTGNLLIADGTQWNSVAMTPGDATITSAGVLTLITVGPGTTPKGTATRSPTVTLDTKGRVTALTDNVITLAGDVTGNVTASVVAKINTVLLGNTTALDGRLLIGETSSSSWISRILSGDATLGSTGTLTLTHINGALLGTTTPLVQGDLLVANATPALARFAGNATATKEFLSMTSGAPLWGVLVASDLPAHNFLDPAVHNNTVVGTPVRGDLIVANATPAWTKLAKGATGTVIRATATDTVSSTFTIPDTFVQGDTLFASAASTLTALAKDTTVGQTRYLSNSGASNNPAWAQVNLANGVQSTLTPQNGGTGFASYTAGDLIFATSSTVLAKLAIGAPNQVLQVVGGLPTWQTAGGATIKVSEDGGATTTVDTLDFTEPDATLITFPVATTARFAMSGYTLKAGRTGTTNNTTLSTNASGTLTGSGILSGSLILQGNPSTTPTGTINFWPNVTTIPAVGTLTALTFAPTLTLQDASSLSAIVLGNGAAWTLDPAATSVINFIGLTLNPTMSPAVAATQTIGTLNLFADQTIFAVDAAATLTLSFLNAFFDTPLFQTAAGGGTINVTNYRGFFSNPRFAGAGLVAINNCSLFKGTIATSAGAETISTCRGLDLSMTLGAGTTTLAIGIDLGVLTATTALSFRSLGTAAQMRHAGPARFGSGTLAPAGSSILHVDGGYTVKRTAPLAAAFPYTLLLTDYYLAVTDTTAARTVNLPSAATAAVGKVYIIKDESGAAGTNNITIAANGADTIDAGLATVLINTNSGVVRLYSNGVAKWFTW